MIVVTASTVLVVATLAVTGYPSRMIVSKNAHAQPEAPAAASSVRAAAVPVPAEMPPAAPAVSAEVAPTTTPKVQKVSVEEPTPQVATHRIIWPPVGATPSAPPAAVPEAGEPGAKAASAEPGTSGSAPEPAPSSDHVNQTPVTITGCLETTVDDGRFRLTDTEGADVPKTRGWRSGFLKKRSAAVEIVQPSDVVALKKLVGRRVVATGLLTDRDLHLQSFQSAGHSCD
jgi:hypothetical protein